MADDTVYLYVLDTMADWEPGYALSELNSGRYFRRPGPSYTVKTFALTTEPVVTMGGVKILPDVTVSEVDSDHAALLILPGGDTWLEPQHASVLIKTAEFLERGIPVAAICGATVALANAGFLNDRPHTSNDLGYLKATCATYLGESHYRIVSAVSDGNLITASGTAPLEFAYQILKKLDVFSEATLDAWYKLFSTHEPKYFYALMQSLEQTA
jgi:putative intracellular protease/amidase